MGRLLGLGLLVLACACTGQPGAEEQLPVPPDIPNDCTPMSICHLSRNATGVIRARVTNIEKPEVVRWRAPNETAWFTPAELADVRVIQGLPTVPLNRLLLGGKVGANGVTAFTIEDDTGLDAARTVEIVVALADEPKAQALLADYWAANEAKGDEM